MRDGQQRRIYRTALPADTLAMDNPRNIWSTTWHL
jgi:hypothetical protein